MAQPIRPFRVALGDIVVNKLRVGINMHDVKYARRVLCNQGHYLGFGPDNLALCQAASGGIDAVGPYI
jgi:hypothetical protein